MKREEKPARLCSAIDTLGDNPDDKDIAEMQPTVWLLPFLLTIQIISFNYPDAKVKSPNRGRRYQEQYAKWLVHTGLVLPSREYRRCFRKALETVLGVRTPEGDYIEAMAASLIKRGHMESRCRFSRLCHRLACRVNRAAATKATALFRKNSYEQMRNICESCRARCLNDLEKEANAKEGKENGCDHEKQGRHRLRTVVRFNPRAPQCGSECFRYVEPRPRYDCYDSPDGMQTPVWGPILWSFIHIVSFAVKGSGKELSNHLCWLIETSRVLPCRYCRDNFFTNLRHALWRMGGEQREWSDVADAVLAWQIVHHVEKGEVDKVKVPLPRELEAVFCLEEGEVTGAHVEAAEGILQARAKGVHPDVSLDWYRLLLDALRGRNRGNRDGKDNAFAQLCFEIHTTVNEMLKKEDAPLSFSAIEEQYSAYRDAEGAPTWHIELCVEAR